MPTYKFRCSECDMEEEDVFKMSTVPDSLEHDCPVTLQPGYMGRVLYPVKTTFKHNDTSGWKGGRKLSKPVRARGAG